VSSSHSWLLEVFRSVLLLLLFYQCAIPSFKLTIISTHRKQSVQTLYCDFSRTKNCWKMFRRLQFVHFKAFGPNGDGVHWKKNWKKKSKKKSISCLFVQTSLCKAKSSKVGLEDSVRHSKQFIQLEMIFTT
jgi:hypothetical protein